MRALYFQFHREIAHRRLELDSAAAPASLVRRRAGQRTAKAIATRLKARRTAQATAHTVGLRADCAHRPLRDSNGTTQRQTSGSFVDLLLLASVSSSSSSSSSLDERVVSASDSTIQYLFIVVVVFGGCGACGASSSLRPFARSRLAPLLVLSELFFNVVSRPSPSEGLLF